MHAGTDSGKLKIDSMIFWVGVIKNGHGLLVHETLKVSFDQSSNTGATDVKMDGSVLEEKSFF